MKKILFLTLTFILGAMAAAGATKADVILDKAAQALRAPKSLTAKFSIHSYDGNASGTIVLSGRKFRMTSPQMSVWFDGKTQWSYSPQAGECNITTPTADELQQTNPLAVVDAYRNAYSARLVSSGKSVCKLQLTARSPRAEIKSVSLEVDARTYYPRSIVLTDRSGRKISITVSSVKAGGQQPASAFVFNTKSYKGVEVVDLR